MISNFFIFLKYFKEDNLGSILEIQMGTYTFYNHNEKNFFEVFHYIKVELR